MIDLEAAYRAEARFRGVLEAAPDAMIIVDQRGRIVLANAQAERLFGFSRAQLLGQPVEMLVPDQFRSKHEAHREGFFTGPQRSRAMGSGVELYGLRSDGTEVPIEISLSPLETEEGRFVISAIRDVSERKAIERREREAQQLREFSSLMKEAVRACPLAITAYDADNELVLWNPAAARLFGYTSAEVIGRIAGTVDPRNARATQLLLEQLQRREPVQDLELEVLRKDGAPIHISVSTGPFRDVSGRGGMMAVIADITERKRAQEALRRNETLAAAGTLAAGVGHEINNPLSYVIMNLDLLALELAGLGAELAALAPAVLPRVERLRAAVEAAQDGGGRVRTIVSDLNLLSRVGSEETTAIDLHKLLDSAARMAQNEIRLRAQLVRQYEPVPVVHASEARLGQVFLNLLVNAAHALPEGDPDGNSILISTATGADGRAIVEITDTGCGIPSEIRDKIFDPFFTTKPPGTGTGLGLSICQSIVTAAGGEISVDSQQGLGATFRVVLPAGQGDVAPRRRSAVPRGRARVLVVDDEPLICQVMRLALEPVHEVVVVDSGAGALEQIASAPAFDVIFCDVMMPAMTGIQLYQRLMLAAPGVERRIVFMTGGAYTQETREFLARVPNRKFHKPFGIEELRSLVAEVLGATE